LYSDSTVFLIFSFDRPRPHETLDHFVKNYMYARGLMPEGDLSLSGFAGKGYQISVTFADGQYSESGGARIFRARNHTYLLVAYSDGEGHSQAVERFLNSLSLASTSGRLVKDDEPIPPFRPSPPPPAGSQGGGNAETRPQPTPDARPADGPFTTKELTHKALIVYKPEPSFTEESKKENVTGVVRLRAVLSSAGKVSNISVVKWLPDGLTENAIQAARHIRFFPARKDGRVVSQYVTLEYNFNIY
jgi:TonB family protein